jgi:thiamine-phosphate pyrophosphorylase
MISRLHYITQEHPHKTHQELALAACKGGARWVQLRIKNKSEDEIRDIAREVRGICKQYHAKIILNDYVHLALELGLDGVHVGKEDMPPRQARKIMGATGIVGATANTLEDVRDLHSWHIDYIGLGPFRFTSTKDTLSPVLGIQGYNEIIASCTKKGMNIPIIAIGGIAEDDIPELMQLGVHGIAVAGAINFHESPGEAVAGFLSKIDIEVYSKPRKVIL